jgi:hypothetical protein
MPDVTLACVVSGPVFERYAAVLQEDAARNFLPGRSEFVILPGLTGWPQASSQRRQVLLDHWDKLAGEHVFLIDADMRIPGVVGGEILADGIVVTTHPGFPEGSNPDECPFCRDDASLAYVPKGAGGRYFPGAFHGGERDAFRELCEVTTAWTTADLDRGVHPEWYDESYLNRYLIDSPPALVLDRRYCWWEYWGPSPEARITHLDKTAEEFEQTRRAA